MAKRLVPIILKLGGSVVTVKETPFRPNIRVIRRLVREISESNSMPLVVVHGGGSYGHPVAKEYKIRDGYTSRSQLIGFSKTRQAMMELNKLMVDVFVENNLPVISVQPSAFILTENSRLVEFDSTINHLREELMKKIYEVYEDFCFRLKLLS